MLFSVQKSSYLDLVYDKQIISVAKDLNLYSLHCNMSLALLVCNGHLRVNYLPLNKKL